MFHTYKNRKHLISAASIVVFVGCIDFTIPDNLKTPLQDTDTTVETGIEDDILATPSSTDSDDGSDEDADPDNDTALDSDNDTANQLDPDGITFTQLTCNDGVSLFGLCWYFGSPGLSCIETCEEHEGYDTLTATIIGTSDEGGSRQNCSAIFTALGYAESIEEGVAMYEGFGCHRLQGTEYRWMVHPYFNPDIGNSEVERICGCME